MNKVILTGRLTKDGEVRTTDKDLKIYSNSIAVNRNYKNKEGKYDTDFFDFTLFNASENFTKYLTKGKQVLVEGKIQKDTYENDKHEKRTLTKVIAEHIELLSSEKKEEKQEEPTLEEIGVPDNYTTEYEEADNSVKLNDNDLPF